MSENGFGNKFSLRGRKVWVAGHRGMVGQALLRRLEREQCEVVTASRSALDLRNQEATTRWMRRQKPDVVIIAAARVGGIAANAKSPGSFLYDNLMIEANIIHAARESGVDKLLFLGSSCIYPKICEQPITEQGLLSGALEPTNEGYAIAKIAGIKLCEFYRAQYGCDFISAMPCNLYGPGDTYDPELSHVIPALMMRAHEAATAGEKNLTVWGSGTPRREFMHVDDLADGLIFMIKKYSGGMHVNIGSGTDVTIAELAHTIARTVGFKGEIIFDRSKPDGTPAKLMDSSHIFMAGWRPRKELAAGLADTYAWYVQEKARKLAA